MEEFGFPKFDFYLDESDPDEVILRRQDGSFVSAFSARGATREGIIEVAREEIYRLKHPPGHVLVGGVFLYSRTRLRLHPGQPLDPDLVHDHWQHNLLVRRNARDDQDRQGSARLTPV